MSADLDTNDEQPKPHYFDEGTHLDSPGGFSWPQLSSSLESGTPNSISKFVSASLYSSLPKAAKEALWKEHP